MFSYTSSSGFIIGIFLIISQISCGLDANAATSTPSPTTPSASDQITVHVGQEIIQDNNVCDIGFFMTNSAGQNLAVTDKCQRGSGEVLLKDSNQPIGKYVYLSPEYKYKQQTQYAFFNLEESLQYQVILLNSNIIPSPVDVDPDYVVKRSVPDLPVVGDKLCMVWDNKPRCWIAGTYRMYPWWKPSPLDMAWDHMILLGCPQSNCFGIFFHYGAPVFEGNSLVGIFDRYFPNNSDNYDYGNQVPSTYVILPTPLILNTFTKNNPLGQGLKLLVG